MRLISITGMVLALMVLAGSCAREKVEDVLGQREDYMLDSVGSAGVGGTVVFKDESSGASITITLTGADPARNYTAGLYENSVTEGGSLVATLGTVPGHTGRLDTLIQQLANGASISYTELVNFNGHVRITEAGAEGNGLVARADIGGNKLTGTSRTYAVDSVNNAVVKGNFTLQERKNGNTLASLALTGTGAPHTYPAFIRDGDISADTAAPQATTAITLGNADPATGRLVMNIKQKDDHTPIQFKDLVTYDGHITVLQQSDTGSLVVAHGNIGRHAP